MSEKHLTELPWKTLVAKLKFKDPGLGKVLADYAKAEEADYASRNKALDGIEKQAAELKKANKDKPELLEYVEEVRLQAIKARKALELLSKAGSEREKKADGEKKEDEKEEDDGEEVGGDRAAIGKQMIALLAKVKSMNPDQPALQFMAATAGGGSSVVLAKRTGTAHKEVLLSLLANRGGAKFLSGTCIWEENKHTFVCEVVPGGLAKKLSKALLEETGQRYAVRVRSADNSVVLDADTDTDPEEGVGPTAPTETKPAGPTAETLSAAMNRLTPEIRAALAANPALKEGLLAQIAGFKSALQAGNLAEGRELLLSVASLVKGVTGRAAETTAAAGSSWKVDFEKIHLDWDARKSAVQAKLEELHTAIIEDWEDPTAETAARNLQKILARFNEGLGDTIDKMRNSADATERARLAAAAGAIAGRYLSYLAQDPVVAHVEANPFEIEVSIREPLSETLTELNAKLGQLPAMAA